jgi:hypothetical protein
MNGKWASCIKGKLVKWQDGKLLKWQVKVSGKLIERHVIEMEVDKMAS